MSPSSFSCVARIWLTPTPAPEAMASLVRLRSGAVSSKRKVSGRWVWGMKVDGIIACGEEAFELFGIALFVSQGLGLGLVDLFENRCMTRTVDKI